ncbi:hypothetical protein GCM10027043_25840 [Ferruginibacter profundus]
MIILPPIPNVLKEAIEGLTSRSQEFAELNITVSVTPGTPTGNQLAPALHRPPEGPFHVFVCAKALSNKKTKQAKSKLFFITTNYINDYGIKPITKAARAGVF